MASQKPLSINESGLFENWLKQVTPESKTIESLRLWWPTVLRTYGSAAAEIFYDRTNKHVVQCDICNRITYSDLSLSAYLGAYNVCEGCNKDFSYCEHCQTYVLTNDLGNVTHVHSKPSKEASFFLVDDQVEAYNADIMDSDRGMFLRTDKEQGVWKHQKQAHISTIFKAHKLLPFRYFGVELEVEKVQGAPPDIILRARNLFGNFVMIKHDGSIGNHGKNGFEIVTVPATLAYHQSGVWDKFFEHLSYFFVKTLPSTGLHVHVGLDTISKVTAGKMGVFVNTTRNREFIESIAGRELGVLSPNGKIYANVRDNWKISDLLSLKQHAPNCVWLAKNREMQNYYSTNAKGQVKLDLSGHPIIGSIKPVSKVVRPACTCREGLYNVDKYQAFNLTTKRPTIELRIFRGIVDKDFLYSALEFADALADFCNETNPGSLTYEQFLNWMCLYNSSGRSKLYPHFSRHLINKGWIDPPKEKVS